MKQQNAELRRFLSIYDQLFLQTIKMLEEVPAQIFESVPIPTDVMYLGSRVNTINISGLVKHLMLAEIHWLKTMKTAVEQEKMPVPQNAKLLEGIEDGKPLIKKYKEIYLDGKQILQTYTDDDLNREIIFFKRQYSVIGFLWIMFGHHSYHLGQIDLLLRQHSINPPEYMEWPNDQTLIA